jgi:WD40 repeat protein
VVTVGRDRTARVWDAATGQPLGQMRHGDSVSRATFSPDGRYVLTDCADGRLRLWDAANGTEVQRVWQGGAAQHVAFSPDGAALMTLEGKVVRLWDLTGAEPAAPAAVARTDGHAWFSPDGKLVLRANGTSAQVSTVDKNQPVGPAQKHKYPVATAAFSADGKRIVTVCNEPGATDPEGLVQVWDAATGEAVGSVLQYVRPVTGASFSPDGKTFLTACADFRVRVYETATGKLIGKPIDHNPAVALAKFSPDGKFVVTATISGVVKTWEAATGEQAGPSTTHGAPLTTMIFNKDGKYLLTADQQGSVFVAEIDGGKQVCKFTAPGGPVTFAAFSPDGKRIVTASGDRSVRVWDVEKSTPVTPPLAQSADSVAAFSPDNRWLATSSGNHFRLWDATTGEAIGPALLHSHAPEAITYLAFTPEGKLVTGAGQADDPRVRQTWNLAPDGRPAGEVLELAQLLSGHRLDGLTVAALPADEAKKAWDALRSRSPADFTPSPERTLAWARRGVDECESQENWAGTVVHLDRLIAAEPGRADLYLRRAAADKALRQWDKAVADYTKAIEQGKDRADLWSARAAAYAEQKQWDKAAADFGKVVELTPNDADAWAKRGRAYAELGQWDKAAADFGKAIVLGREEATTFRDQALARLGAGDLAGYKQLCGRMSKRFGNQLAAAQLVGWTCSLAPEALPDLKPLLKPAERAQADNPKSMAHLLAVAALLYRTGQLQPALQQMEKAQPTRAATDAPTDWLLLAMTQQRLSRPEEAKKWLDKATQAQAPTTVKEAQTWQERLEVALLLKEAETLVKGTKN